MQQRIPSRLRRILLAVFFLLAAFILPGWAPLTAFGQTTAIHIDSPMTPPAWAVMERQLLEANEVACREFFARYFDERGYLLCVERWGGDDGPDDAIENVANWPILHALGASDDILTLYKKAWEGHLRQYTEAKTVEVPFARDGMYYKEFPVMMDWLHNGEGLRVFNLQGLSDPYDVDFGHRVRRYAGFYMNEEFGADNYDPKHKIIRSMFNGSRGPLLRKATGLDWAGDPIEVEGRFELGHGERTYEEMVAHFKDYNDIIGDHPQNLCATTLALNAYMLTGEEKYKTWLLEYVDAWLERMEKNNDIIPSNIGLDGTIGGATDGKWYGGVYGWGFTVEVPQTGALANRTTVYLGLDGFGNAHLLTGDRKYARAWGRMLDKLATFRKVENGKTLYPQMHGDDGWYAYSTEPYSHGALECYFWLGTPKDRVRVRSNSWLSFLEGNDPDYPLEAMSRDFAEIRTRVAAMRADTTTPDTRLADDPMKFNPAAVHALRQLMMGGLDPSRGGGPLHCRLRYFDPQRRRAGIPEDVAALIDRDVADELRVTLVNLNQSDARDVIVQGGAYGEHRFVFAKVGEQRTDLDASSVRVSLKPGCGARITLIVDRYANQPTLKFPAGVR